MVTDWCHRVMSSNPSDPEKSALYRADDSLPKSTDFPTCTFIALHPPNPGFRVALHSPIQEFACSSVFARFLPEEGKVFENSVCSLPKDWNDLPH
ncbi:hypothetical protein TNCV_551991 [Trichonephila clavipes]|nr:hypothetical protein TNCV_551991 [Trichonephila clavipes]